MGGETVLTSIFKKPVDGRLRVSKLNFEGDEQSDLTVHGGVDKAVYAYPSEHYAEWRREIPEVDFSWSDFGENLTIEGLLEDVRNRRPLPDRDGGVRRHPAEAPLLQARYPVWPDGHAQENLRNGRTGFYFAVATEGEVGAGDTIEPIERASEGLTVADVVRLYTVDAKNQVLLRQATQTAGLPESWKDYFRKRLWNPDA